MGSFEYIEPTDVSYGIVIEKTKTRRRTVEKVESFNTTNLGSTSSLLGDSCDYSKTIINYRNISDDRLSILTKKMMFVNLILKLYNKFMKNFSK